MRENFDFPEKYHRLAEQTALESFDQDCVLVEAIELMVATAFQKAGGGLDEVQDPASEVLHWPIPRRFERLEVVAIQQPASIYDRVRVVSSNNDELNPYCDPDVEYPSDDIWGKR